MNSQIIPIVSCSGTKDADKEYYEPWRNFIPQPISQSLFYFSSTDFRSVPGKNSTTVALWKKKEVTELVAFTHPIAAILCRAVYESYHEDDHVWVVEGNAEDGVCSIEGRVGIKKGIILKRSSIRLTMTEAFKVVGGAIMKIHQERDFTEWFIDSIGERNQKNLGGQEISSFGRKVAAKYRDSGNLDKSYEYMAAAHLAEYKDSKESELYRRRKLGLAFLFALYAAHLRGKNTNISEICERTLTLIRMEDSKEISGLPVKIEAKFREDDEGKGWSEHSLHA